MWLFSVIWEVITYHVWTCSKKYIIAWTLIMHQSLLQSIICMVNVDITCTNEWLFICFLPQFCFIKTVQNSVRLKLTNFKSASKSRFLFSRGHSMLLLHMQLCVSQCTYEEYLCNFRERGNCLFELCRSTVRTSAASDFSANCIFCVSAVLNCKYVRAWTNTTRVPRVHPFASV